MSQLTKVEMPVDFLKDLPVSTKKVKSRRLRLISKGKIEGRYERLKHLKEKFSRDVITEKNRLDALKHKQQTRLDATPNVGRP